MSLPPEILKKVKLLEISTRKLVNSVFAGEYHSAFKGQGMTFSELREYVHGDDVRSISWTVTARTGKPFIKKFDEERELNLILAADISGSLSFGTQEYFKGEVVAHLSALLGFSANKNKDGVGLLLFSDHVEHYVPPKKSRGHVHRILRDIYYHKPQSSRTHISSALEHLQGVLKKRSNIFLFSDFFDEGYEKNLKLLGKRHDVVAVVVKDPFEENLPDLGLVNLHDPETGETLPVDTSSPSVRRSYNRFMSEQKDIRDKYLRSAQVEKVEIDCRGDITMPLLMYFKKRNR